MPEMVREVETDEGFYLGSDEDESTQADKYLLFDIEGEMYGIGIAYVTEIIEMQKITEIPDMPMCVKGVINLRGRIIPVIDLRLRFGMGERAYDDRTCTIIVNLDDASLGLIVDTVAEVHDIPERDIDPPLNFKTDTEKNQYISGLGKANEEVIILIDVKRILHTEELETITTN